MSTSLWQRSLFADIQLYIAESFPRARTIPGAQQGHLADKVGEMPRRFDRLLHFLYK